MIIPLKQLAAIDKRRSKGLELLIQLGFESIFDQNK